MISWILRESTSPNIDFSFLIFDSISSPQLKCLVIDEKEKPA